jgi:lipopolysaccharide transport system permease protein
VLGGFWALLSPLIMLCIYTFVFQYIFKSRWSDHDAGTFEFALNLYTGLLIFNWFAESVSRAPKLILEQPYLVNKVVFPLAILGWVTVLVSAVQMVLSLFLLIVMAIILGYPIEPQFLLIPMAPVLVLPWLLSLVWFLSGIGVFLRDLSQIIPIAVTSAMFLSPILYPIKALPERFQFLAYFNPLALCIETLRGILFTHQHLQPLALVLTFVAGTVLAFLSLKVFHRLSKSFSDVL